MDFSASIAKTALTSLRWSCLLIQSGYKVNEEATKAEISKVVEAQGILLASVVGADDSKLLTKAYAMVLFVRWWIQQICNLNFLYSAGQFVEQC